MGNLRPQPTLTGLPASPFPDDIGACLAGFFATQMAADTSPDQGPGLAGMSLQDILIRIETARPKLSHAEELALYQQWIAANGAGQPTVFAAWFNLAVLLAGSGDTGNAATAYRNALALRPDLHAAAVNLGLLLEAEGQPAEALGVWQRAVQPDHVRTALQIQQGRLQEKLGRLDEAEATLRRVLLADPDQPDVLHHWVHIRQRTCQWPIAGASIPGLTPEQVLHGAGPLGVLALTDDIGIQRAAAETWIARKTEPAPRRLAPARPYRHDRIRVGYMSSDFCSHAMSYLITELFERHDRQRFEVFGYCASNDDGSPIRRRITAAFDHHRIIRKLTDEQAAELIRADEIDVLIDLNGITDGTRITVVRWRPAPVQATYLGFIGALPLPELDYILCDDVVIPPEHAGAYRPAPLPIGAVYQANDTRRAIGRSVTRAEAGLPADRFVLCCLSRHYKITQDMFGAWMDILRAAEGAVLWLASDNDWSRANLIAEAGRAGIAPDRLIFADRTDPELYMSRLRLADLFLDTFPYNAGTVASDAIRMQLPLLTLCGQAFASRMATSLLHAIGAPEGITTSLPRYVATAIRLATDPGAYAAYKARFTAQAWNSTLGNIDRFTRGLEDTLARLVLPV